MTRSARVSRNAIVTWDWKDQPDWTKINEALGSVGQGARIAPVETGEDVCAVVVTTHPRRAQRVFDAWRVGD